MIKAECHSDDRASEVEFDATPWFERASNKEIADLARCGWGGGDPADAVAEFCSDTDENVKKVFDYLNIIKDDPSKKDCCGFECHVDQEDAVAWIRVHRAEMLGRGKTRR